MKKLLFILSFFLSVATLHSQTVTELTNIINTKPQSISTASAGSLNADLFSIDLSTSGYRLIGIQITGTWVGTISFQGSNDNFTTSTLIYSYQPSLATGWQTTTTANGQFNIPTQGFRYVRVRMTAYTSGSATSTAYGFLSATNNGNINGSVSIIGTVPVSGTFWQATQPVSGTFWQATQPVSISGNQAVNVAQINAVTPLMGNGITGTGSQRVTIASDNTAFSVNANAGTNLNTSALALDATLIGGTQQTKITDGTNIATVKAASTAALAADKAVVVAVSPNNTVAVTGTFFQGTQPVSISGNQAINVAQINAVTPLMGNGITGTGSQRVTIASDNTPFPIKVDQTTPGTTNAVSIAQIGANTVLAGKGTNINALRVSVATEKTYQASTAAVLVPAVTASVPFVVIYGSGTKTIRVQKIIVEGLTLTAVQYLNIGLAKYSTAPSGGTITTFTQIPMDANDAAATASLVQGYTAVPTTGTRIGFISGKRVMGQATTAAAGGVPQELYFEWSNGQDALAPVLRGTAQGIGLEWIGTVPASTVSMLVTIVWTEE